MEVAAPAVSMIKRFAIAIQASRNAEAPVAQALEMLVTGMPVWPISRMIAWPVMS